MSEFEPDDEAVETSGALPQEENAAADFLAGTTTPDDVRAAYRWLLGREVENDLAIQDQLVHEDRRELRRVLLSSQEFSDAYQASGAEVAARWVATETPEGRLLWLDLNDRFVSRGVLNGTWKPAEARLARQLLKPGDGCIDAGANIGWFSALAAERVGRFGQVVAYEPFARVRQGLERSVRANGWSAIVKVSSFALWDETVPAWLAEDPDRGNLGHSWVEAEPQGDDRAPIECRRLDDLDDVFGLRLVKLSVEGAEFKALAGAEQTLRGRGPVVLADLNVPMLRQVSQVGARDLHDLMASFGYECRLIDDQSDGSETVETAPASADVLERLDEDRVRSLVFSR